VREHGTLGLVEREQPEPHAAWPGDACAAGG
jgi:hypothetical protein